MAIGVPMIPGVGRGMWIIDEAVPAEPDPEDDDWTFRDPGPRWTPADLETVIFNGWLDLRTRGRQMSLLRYGAVNRVFQGQKIEYQARPVEAVRETVVVRGTCGDVTVEVWRGGYMDWTHMTR